MGPHPHPIVDLGPVALAGRRACYGGGRHLAVARALRPADLRGSLQFAWEPIGEPAPADAGARRATSSRIHTVQRLTGRRR
jgi:hypothetical protein